MPAEFREMISPAEADALLAEAMPRYPAVTLPLGRCEGRILRSPIRADRAQPPFDRVAMDGIAFAYAAWEGGRRRFAVEGTQLAGEPARALRTEGGCLEVMTGAVLPRGADCVAPVETVRIRDGHAELAETAPAPEPYRHVHRAGGDCAAGEVIVPEGIRLSAPHLGAAAAFGLEGLSVSEAPVVAVVATGDELVDPGREPLPHQIRRSNPSAIEAALYRRRIENLIFLHAADDRARLRACLETVLGRCGALILTGGVSMGKTDHVPGVLAELGIRPLFHKIAQKPGKPFWFGLGAGGLPVFALPGNPASVLVCLHRYVLPALARALGAADETPMPARLEEGVDRGRLAQFLPVTCAWGPAGGLRARRVENRGSGDFSGWARAEGLAEVEAGEGRMEAGGAVRFWPW